MEKLDKMKKERNASIDIFRIICAVMVIAIHTHPFEELNYDVSYVFTQIIPRIAVPFFFCVIGYYYLRKLENHEKIFRKTILKYLFLYLIWSGIYLIVNLIQEFKSGADIKIVIKNIVYGLFVNGISEHLWFFIGIFFCLIIVTVFFKIFKRLDILAYISIVLFIIGLLGTSYYGLGIQVGGLNSLILFKHFTLIRRVVLMGFPFFMMGYFISKFKINNANKKVNFIIEIVLMVLFVIEIAIINNAKISANVIMTMILYPLLFNTMIILLNNPLPKLENFAIKCRNIANFTYYSHVLILLIFSRVVRKIFGISSQTLNFFGTTILCVVIGLVLERINNKYINKLYK